VSHETGPWLELVRLVGAFVLALCAFGIAAYLEAQGVPAPDWLKGVIVASTTYFFMQQKAAVAARR
jgi:hypothetical protein